MAAGAGRAGAMAFHSLTKRLRRFLSAPLERRDVRKWWRRRRAEHVLEHPLPSQHRRRAIRARGHHQQSALAEQTATRVVGQRHLAELAAVDVRNAVML